MLGGHPGLDQHDLLSLTLVRFGQELIALNPDRMRHSDTLDDVLTRLARRVARTAAALADLEVATVLGGRVHDVAGDTWMPEIVLLAATPTDTQLARFQRLITGLAAHDRLATAIVVAGTLPGARWTATVDNTGR